MRISVIPAYGRDYKSKREIEMSMKENLDFKISDISSPHDGRYINLAQIVEAGITTVNVRYAKLTKIHVVEVAKLKPAKKTG
jgi:hypothetical protein